LGRWRCNKLGFGGTGLDIRIRLLLTYRLKVTQEHQTNDRWKRKIPNPKSEFRITNFAFGNRLGWET
jgi:hypothetical protein